MAETKLYKNKNLGEFKSIPLKLVDESKAVDSLYLALNFKKLNTKPVADVRKSKDYASTLSAWEKKLEGVDMSDLNIVAQKLGYDVEVFNPLSPKARILFSGGGRSKRTAQLLKVKAGVYKPMRAGAVTRRTYQQGLAEMAVSRASFRDQRSTRQEFIRVMTDENSTPEMIRQSVENPKILIDAWNEILSTPRSDNTLILRKGKIEFDEYTGRIRDDFFEEVTQCQIIEDNPIPVKIHNVEYTNYPTCPINYEGIGFSTEEDGTIWTGEYYYYMKSSDADRNKHIKTCFNKSSYDLNPNKQMSPLTREPLVSIFQLVSDLVSDSIHRDIIPAKVKEHLKDLYAEDLDLPDGHEEFKEWLRDWFSIRDSNGRDIGGDIYDAEDFRLDDVYILRIPEGNRDDSIEIPPEIGLLKNLKGLQLYHHEDLSELPDTIANLQNLETLEIYNCSMSAAGLAPVASLRNLKKLILGRAFSDTFTFADFPAGIWQLPNLETLIMEDNAYDNYDNAVSARRAEFFDLAGYYNLDNLKTLSLKNNRLSRIPSSVYKCRSLMTLDLRNNAIEHIDDDIAKYSAQSLRSLYLDYNALYTINDKIGKLVNLETLTCSHNQIEYLPRSLANLQNLLILDLQSNGDLFGTQNTPEFNAYLRTYGQSSVRGPKQNPIRTIISKLVGLKVLKVGGMHFSWNIGRQNPIVPPEIGDLKSLELLSLNGLGIKELPSEIGKLAALKYLYLQQNRLREIPREMLELRNLQYLNLEANKKSFTVKGENGNIVFNNKSGVRGTIFFDNIGAEHMLSYLMGSESDDPEDFLKTQSYLKALLAPTHYMKEKIGNLIRRYGYKVKNWDEGSSSSGIDVFDVRIETDPDIEIEQSSESDSESVQGLGQSDSDSDSGWGPSDSDSESEEMEVNGRIRSRDEEDVDRPRNRRRFGGSHPESDRRDSDLANAIEVMFRKMNDMQIQKKLVNMIENIER